MKLLVILTLLAPHAHAEEFRVLIDGTGCRTRQLAIRKSLEKIPGVEEVTILPRNEAPADNQRYFTMRSKVGSPTKEELVAALGRRAKHHRILTASPVTKPQPAPRTAR